MGKTTYLRLKGSQNLRQRLLLSTLVSTPVLVEDIRADETWPGLRPHEVSFLRLLEKICDDCVVEINETGTKLKYKPGIVMGGKHLVHDCGVSRSIGYFLEPLIVLGLFGKKPLSIRLKGITNDSKDPSVDTFRSTTLPMLKRFGVPSEGLELKIESRGVPPHGGGEVFLSIPIVKHSLTAVTWIDEGMVKRIRGVTFSTRVSVQFENTMIHAARGIFNRLLPDVHIFTDHKAGTQAGKSPGYGISLVAETTTGCFISADTAVSYARGDEEGEIEEEEKKELMPPVDVGEQIASILLGEIEQGGGTAQMEEAVAELERRQVRILQRITELELSHLPQHFSDSLSVSSPNGNRNSDGTTAANTEARLSAILRANSVRDFSFKRVPSDYYDWPFEARRDVLGASSVDHLCKSIVLVNTQAPPNVTDCSDHNNSKYYVVVVQYTARFNAETVKNFLYSLNNGKIPKKKFNLRLAPDETSQKLTGFAHNAVTCIGMKTDIPVILDEAIVKLYPDFFWLGGGEVDLKLGVRTSEFVNFVRPFIVSCSGT